MSQPAIRVEGLWKDYVIGRQQRHAETFYELLSNTLSAPFRNRNSTKESDETHFWALKDINFEVQPGEVVGVIGRNGAGKSTLLKILSRITAPTKGRVEVRGRLASLLEVGTGFHPELSGRENVFLNGAILGMSRAEVARKFDEIVTFAEVEKFIDTPVKRYSSGMYVRLAFAVAAHLDSDVLIVDEVLAVGDLDFQRKCLGKMGDVSRLGRSIIFVSHNLRALQQLCGRAVWLDHGCIHSSGLTAKIVDNYIALGLPPAVAVWRPSVADQQAPAVIESISMLDEDGVPVVGPIVKGLLKFEFRLHVRESIENLCIGFDLCASDGVVVLRSFHRDDPTCDHITINVGTHLCAVTLDSALFNAGAYFLAPKLSNHNIAWIHDGDPVLRFDIARTPGLSSFRRTLIPDQWPGVVAPIYPWRISEQSAP